MCGAEGALSGLRVGREGGLWLFESLVRLVSSFICPNRSIMAWVLPWGAIHPLPSTPRLTIHTTHTNTHSPPFSCTSATSALPPPSPPPSGHQSDVDLVRWHPNCHYVATASSDRSVRLWDVASGACVRAMGGLRNSAPTSLAMSPDGKQVCV